MSAPLLAGRHCAIVGATGVIGAHIAQTFARHGAVLSLLGRSAPQARPRLEAQITPYAPTSPPQAGADAAGPGAHRYIRLDVSDKENVREVFGSLKASGGKENRKGGSIENAVGPVDILVNCAGISQTTLLKRTPDDELQGIVDTNLMSAMLASKYARLRPDGCIINVSSLMAIKGGLGATAYAASKAGLVGFTRALCREMAARSIRVNALLPGWVESPMWNNLKPELRQAYLKDTPLGRAATPDEVADAALFLASNGYANNCILNLDGGLSAG